ncbi:CHASE3 domain-containing protein [Devosia sp. 2618]|uniref:sensor histidine kinase n=1 Tax=Devosia sp. 2618 TaxID=3156454 RepID=UPI003394461D
MFASLALVVLAAVSALFLVQGIDRQIGDVTGTYDVRSQARELSMALSEAENSQLGYVLTGDTSYVEPFQRSIAAIAAHMDGLSTITKADPLRSSSLLAIAAEVRSITDEMSHTVDLVQANRNGEARALIRGGSGEQIMDELRDMLEQFIAADNDKLIERSQTIDQYRRWLVAAIIAALAGAVLLTYVLLSRTQRQVSALAQSQNALLTENEALEAHVAERTKDLVEARAYAERERQRVEALLQDSSHRIGNSLATVSSLLGLQLLRSNSDEVRQALEAARLRVHAIASAHRRLRLGDDMETVSADEFLSAVLEDIGATADDPKAINLSGKFDLITISARDATTIGILVGELVTNAVKHGFPNGRTGTITVALQRDAVGVPVLSVADDGVGIAADKQPGDGGLGSVIIKQLAKQFGGEPQYERRDGGGLIVKVPLPGIENAPPLSSS